MAASLPWSLIVAWIAFFGFLQTHQRHSSRFLGSSQGYGAALSISTLAGTIAGLGLLVYYGVHTAWYWLLLLAIIGSIFGGVLFSIIERKVGVPVLSPVSFLGWPVAAWYVYRIASTPAAWW